MSDRALTAAERRAVLGLSGGIAPERYARCQNCGGAEGDHVLPIGARAGFCRCGPDPERYGCKCPEWRPHPVARLKQALAADPRFEMDGGHLSVREREREPDAEFDDIVMDGQRWEDSDVTSADGEKPSTGAAVPTCPDIKLHKVVMSGQE